MKKIGAIVLLIAGVISAAVGVITLLRLKSSVPSGATIIGGADGPTTVFLAGRVGAPVFGAIIAGILLVVIGIVLLVKNTKE